jgi:hypothetical protein
MAGFFNADEGVLRGHIDVYITAMMELSAIKIAWKDWGDHHNIISVGFRIYEPKTDPSTSWMSYKFKSAGLAYKIAVSLTTNEIVWINSPFKASTGDLAIFKDHGLADMIGPNQKAVTDRGYTGAGPGYDEKLAIQNRMDPINIREFKKCARTCSP